MRAYVRVRIRCIYVYTAAAMYAHFKGAVFRFFSPRNSWRTLLDGNRRFFNYRDKDNNSGVGSGQVCCICCILLRRSPSTSNLGPRGEKLLTGQPPSIAWLLYQTIIIIRVRSSPPLFNLQVSRKKATVVARVLHGDMADTYYYVYYIMFTTFSDKFVHYCACTKLFETTFSCIDNVQEMWYLLLVYNKHYTYLCLQIMCKRMYKQKKHMRRIPIYTYEYSPKFRIDYIAITVYMKPRVRLLNRINKL